MELWLKIANHKDFDDYFDENAWWLVWIKVTWWIATLDPLFFLEICLVLFPQLLKGAHSRRFGRGGHVVCSDTFDGMVSRGGRVNRQVVRRRGGSLGVKGALSIRLGWCEGREGENRTRSELGRIFGRRDARNARTVPAVLRHAWAAAETWATQFKDHHQSASCAHSHPTKLLLKIILSEVRVLH